MTPFYSDDWLTLYGGDCREVLAGLPADSVDCVVTSPPYWGLRDYGTATWSGGGWTCGGNHPSTADPDHWNKSTAEIRAELEAEAAEEYDPANCPMCNAPPCDHVDPDWQARVVNSPKQQTQVGSYQRQELHACRKCGATRIDSQLGLERTPEEYVANMVAVFREVRRVLKPSGTCWLNLGDSYAGSGKGGNPAGSEWSGFVGNGDREKAAKASPPYLGLAQKQLVGIPWRVAFALQADGWYLRSDIIWSKPNPMPESVTDRPTKSHEYLFLLTKSARYYFDNEAVREPEKPWNGGRINAPKFGPERLAGGPSAPGTTSKTFDTIKGANIRSVWTIATRPYPGAHFAVFPPELPERCIKAGSSEKGVCPECGAPWERVRIKVAAGAGRRVPTDEPKGHPQNHGGASWVPVTYKDEGWGPTCAHEPCPLGGHRFHDHGAYEPRYMNDPEPAVILDPFGGSGTVGMVANRLSRRAILVDLNPEYLAQQMKRNAQTPLGLTEGDAA